MSSVTGVKSMNWFPKPSAWKTLEAQRAKRQQMLADFQSQSAMLASGFSRATAIQIQGVGDLAVQTVQTRLQARAKEMQAEAEAKFAVFDKLA